jgi:hypothetical protein
MAMGRQRIAIVQISCIIRQREDVHLMSRRHGPQLVKSTDFIAFVRGIRDAVAKVKNSHKFPKIW